MNPFEKNSEDEEAERLIRESKAMDRKFSAEEEIELDKIATANEQLEKELGQAFLDMETNAAAVLIEKRVKENDAQVQKEITEMTD
jgi:hypothetical protein